MNFELTDFTRLNAWIFGNYWGGKWTKQAIIGKISWSDSDWQKYWRRTIPYLADLFVHWQYLQEVSEKHLDWKHLTILF